MLGVMRKYKQSIIIKLVFGAIVLSFVGATFLVWGTGDSGSFSGGYAARVNGTSIPVEEYMRNYDHIRKIYEQVYGQALTPEMEKQMGLKKLALDNLIDTVLVRREAKRMGMRVSAEEIQSAIAAVPAFQKNDGFDFQQYQQMLKGARMTPKDFEKGQQDELLIKKAKQKIKDKATISDDEALQAFRKQNDKLDLQFVSFAPADVKGEVKLSEEELKSYLQSHHEEFKTPEQVSIYYAMADPRKLAVKSTVTDDEAETFYRKNIDRYQGKDGILPFSEVKEQAHEDALYAKRTRDAYEMTADVINKNRKTGDINAASAALGIKPADTPFFTVLAPAAQLAGETEVIRRALAMKEGELGGPVETARGIYILKLKERKPAAIPPLPRIRSQVESRVMADKAIELARKKAEKSLASLLAKEKPAVQLQETGNFGYSAGGDIPAIGKAPDLMEAAFALTTAAPVAKTPYNVGDRWFAVKLKSRSETNSAEFQKKKEQLKQELLPRKQQEAVDAWLKGLRDKTKIEINQALLTD
jgi:peptidyl-prolyl cis-trans isomerase D